jgi:collagenase-like PrtC family protease
MVLHTLEGRPFLAINGIQTQSYTCLNLAGELDELAEAGISRFRISPQSTGTVAATETFHALLNKEITSAEASECLQEHGLSIPFSNGFYHQQPGFEWHA